MGVEMGNIGFSSEPLCQVLHFDSGKDSVLRTSGGVSRALVPVQPRSPPQNVWYTNVSVFS
jgi:hypothetical protein